MGIKDQLKKIEKLYSTNLDKKGIDSTAVGWNTAESQELRFAKLSSVIESNAGPISVNDYGCGYGAHLNFLINQLGLDVHGYNGYDLSTEMLSTAREQLGFFSGELNLIESDTLHTTADYSFVSGTFNVRFEADDEEWKSYIESKLHELDTYSTKGFSFNLLTSYVDWEEPHLYYGDPCYWFDYCKRHFSKQVALLHDYPLWEWTIVVKKNEKS